MKIALFEGLPNVTMALSYRGQILTIENVLIDTGSVGSIFSVDKVLEVGLQLEPDDFVHRIRGVGGTEFVFTKRVDNLLVGDLEVKGFEEVGAMAYGSDIQGILGMDFLQQVGAVVDLAQLEIRPTFL